MKIESAPTDIRVLLFDVGGVLVRVAPGVDMGFLGAVLRAVKSA